MGLKGKRTLLYLCPACREALFQVPKLIRAYEGLREELDDVKKLLAQPIAATPPLPSTPSAVTVVAQPQPDTNAIMEEILERERRANNVILVGVKECDSENGNARKTHDESCVKKILTDVGGADCRDKLVTVQRLGRREDGKTRPVKVVLSSRQDAVWILKNKSKADREVRVYDDKTPKQREDLQQLREALKTRVERGETSLTIRYVKGVPKIVNQKN